MFSFHFEGKAEGTYDAQMLICPGDIRFEYFDVMLLYRVDDIADLSGGFRFDVQMDGGGIFYHCEFNRRHNLKYKGN